MNSLGRLVTHDAALNILAYQIIEIVNTMLLTPVKHFSGTKELKIYNKIST